MQNDIAELSHLTPADASAQRAAFLKDTWTPVFVSVPGLPAAYVIAISVEALILWLLLRRRLRLAHS